MRCILQVIGIPRTRLVNLMQLIGTLAVAERNWLSSAGQSGCRCWVAHSPRALIYLEAPSAARESFKESRSDP